MTEGDLLFKKIFHSLREYVLDKYTNLETNSIYSQR